MCEHIHLPVQAGDNSGTREHAPGLYPRGLRCLVGRIRGRVPGVAISTDIIVGFPGETEEQYQRTLDLLEEVRFSTVYVAAYSPRPGTLSARWEDDVPPADKKERVERLDRLQQRISLAYHRER